MGRTPVEQEQHLAHAHLTLELIGQQWLDAKASGASRKTMIALEGKLKRAEQTILELEDNNANTT